MLRLSVIFISLALGCSHEVTCKILAAECIDEMEMWTCIDGTNQQWYEFSDGTQVACGASDCGIAADEATAYCNGEDWVAPE